MYINKRNLEMKIFRYLVAIAVTLMFLASAFGSVAGLFAGERYFLGTFGPLLMLLSLVSVFHPSYLWKIVGLGINTFMLYVLIDMWRFTGESAIIPVCIIAIALAYMAINLIIKEEVKLDTKG